MQIIPVKTGLIRAEDDLFKVIKSFLKGKIEEKDVLVVASKVVALTEGRKVKREPIAKLLEKEADKVLSSGKYALTIKDGSFLPNAGIDHSNVEDGFLILLPENAYKSAEKLREKIKKYFGLKKVGVLICDSHCQPLRKGITGLALGLAGFEGVEDLRGKKDLFGNKFQVTQRNLADQIASAALLVMGEGVERTPLALVKDCPVKFTDRKIRRGELLIKPRDCLFRVLYN